MACIYWLGKMFCIYIYIYIYSVNIGTCREEGAELGSIAGEAVATVEAEGSV